MPPETLAQRLNRVKTFAAGEAAALIIQVCRGLAPFHARGIVHRAITPAALFMMKRGDGSDLFVTVDFATKATASRYLAPELMRSALEVDGRADIWSLGVTLYEMLAPAIVAGPLGSIVRRCLEMDPAERYATVEELARALEALV